MHMTEAGVHVVIQADRPETYDLIRRHVEQLQAQLSSFGLGNASISLGYDGDNPEMPQDEETAVKALPHDESEHPEVDTLRYAPLGVDIRL